LWRPCCRRVNCPPNSCRPIPRACGATDEASKRQASA
jgi:hypothetical protein